MEPNPQKRITIDGIKQHPWYLGVTPSYEEVAAEMKQRGEIILTQNQEKLKNYYAQKRRKTKPSSSRLAMSNKRNGVELEVENFRQMMRPEIEEINLKIMRSSKERAIAKFAKENSLRSSPESLKAKSRRRSSEENLAKEKQALLKFQGQNEQGGKTSLKERGVYEGNDSGSMRQFSMRKDSSKGGDRIKMQRSGSDD